MNLTKAAWELDAIRNDRSSTVQELQERCDKVGFWLASQKTSKKQLALLSECHELHQHLQGNTGFKHGCKQIQMN